MPRPSIGIAVAVAVACGMLACRPAGPVPPLRPLEGSLAPVRDAFNAAEGSTRVVALLSPT